MDNQIRAALIGFGGMGKIYAKMLWAGMVPGLKLTGVCSRNPDGQSLLRREYPGVCIYTDADDMAAHAAEFDAAIIVTPIQAMCPSDCGWQSWGSIF